MYIIPIICPYSRDKTMIKASVQQPRHAHGSVNDLERNKPVITFLSATGTSLHIILIKTFCQRNMLGDTHVKILKDDNLADKDLP